MIARLLLLTVLLLAASPSRIVDAWLRSAPSVQSNSPEQEDGWAAIKTDEGVLFVWNQGELHFTLTIKGKEIKPADNPEHIFFDVDGKVLQIQLASIKDFAPNAREKKLDDKAILAAHRDWEAQYIGGLLHSDLKVQPFNAKLSNGAEASMWQFDMPAGSQATKQVYLTIVRSDYVLLLNTEASDALSDRDGRKFLLETIGTLKMSPTSIDVKQLAESISAKTKP